MGGFLAAAGILAACGEDNEQQGQCPKPGVSHGVPPFSKLQPCVPQAMGIKGKL
jgi:hypothetical protein